MSNPATLAPMTMALAGVLEDAALDFDGGASWLTLTANMQCCRRTGFLITESRKSEGSRACACRKAGDSVLGALPVAGKACSLAPWMPSGRACIISFLLINTPVADLMSKFEVFEYLRSNLDSICGQALHFR